MEKQALRKIYLEKRKQLSHRELKIKDDLILIQFQHFDFGALQAVLSYQPIAKLNEPATQLITDYLSVLYPNIITAYPISDFTTNTMQAMVSDQDTMYEWNDYAIAEPISTEVLNPSDIDLIIVPLLCVDTRGYRVGYGKGFYDKYIQSCRSDVLKIGISYFAPTKETIDINGTDIPLDFCVTPEKIYAF